MISTASVAPQQQRIVPPSELANSSGEAMTGFESMLAAASSAKAPMPTPSATPAPAQTASIAPKHAAPAERAPAADGDTKPTAADASSQDGGADETKNDTSTSSTSTDAATAKTDPSKDAADAAATTAVPTENASILTQIIAALGQPTARGARIPATAATASDASSDATTAAAASAGAIRKGLDLTAATAGSHASAASAARSQAAADPSAAATASASGADERQGFSAALTALHADASPDTALAALAGKPATADTAPIPTAGALDIASLGGATPASTVAVATATSRIESRVGSAAFGDELVDQVKQFAMDKIEVAQLVLNPEGMGPVKVEIAYDQGQAAVHFTAERAETRQALESHFDQLRTALSGSGIDLGNASTGQFSEGRAFEFMQQGRDRGQGSGSRSRSGSGSTSGVSSTTAAAAPVARAARTVDGNVDLFA